MVLTREAARELEQQTRKQVDSYQWRIERRKRITASKAGGIAKVRATIQRSWSKKVQELLYSTFRGNKATIHGSGKEEIARQECITRQQEENHPNLDVQDCGLFISQHDHWLAVTPDGSVHDPAHPPGLLDLIQSEIWILQKHARCHHFA